MGVFLRFYHIYQELDVWLIYLRERKIYIYTNAYATNRYFYMIFK